MMMTDAKARDEWDTETFLIRHWMRIKNATWDDTPLPVPAIHAGWRNHKKVTGSGATKPATEDWTVAKRSPLQYLARFLIVSSIRLTQGVIGCAMTIKRFFRDQRSVGMCSMYRSHLCSFWIYG